MIGAHVPAPAGLDSPMRWGDERHIVERFGPQAADISCTRRVFNFRYKSTAHWVEVFRAFYGPIHKAFAALGDAGQERLHADLVALLDGYNRGGGHSLLVPGEYLEVVVTTRDPAPEPPALRPASGKMSVVPIAA